MVGGGERWRRESLTWEKVWRIDKQARCPNLSSIRHLPDPLRIRGQDAYQWNLESGYEQGQICLMRGILPDNPKSLG